MMSSSGVRLWVGSFAAFGRRCKLPSWRRRVAEVGTRETALTFLLQPRKSVTMGVLLNKDEGHDRDLFPLNIITC